MTGFDAVRASYDAVRASYDAVAERYAEEVGEELPGKPIDRALYAAFAELVRELCGAGRSVGDVGCGPGHVTRHLAGLGLSVFGVDISPGMVAVARRRHPHLRFEEGSFARLPVGDGEWAGAVAPYSIIHLDGDDRRAGFAELARAITPGGWLLVAFHVSRDDQPPGSVFHLDRWWGHDVELPFHFLDPAEVAAEVQGAGFTVMSRTERAPWAGVEAPTRRGYLLAQHRPDAAG
jgi:SAM-dependent methyltransferase